MARTAVPVPLVLYLGGVGFELMTPQLRLSSRSSCPDAAAINPVIVRCVSIQKMQTPKINLDEQVLYQD